MRLARYVSIKIAFFAVIFIVTACGKPRETQTSNQADDNRPTTGGTAGNRSYTAYGPAPDVEKIKERIKVTPANQEFAGNIETAYLMRHHGLAEASNALRINLKWSGLSKQLEFWGELKSDKGRLVGTLREETRQRRDLVIIAACADQDCNLVSADIYSNRILKTGVIFRREQRLVRARVGEREREILKCYDKKNQDAIEKYIEGVNVTVASTEIVPGRTHFKLYESKVIFDHAQLEGSILTTDGDCTPLKGDGESIFARVCLAGNNGTGNLVFRAQMPPLPATCNVSEEVRQDPAIYLQTKRVDPTTPSTPTAPQQPDSNQQPVQPPVSQPPTTTTQPPTTTTQPPTAQPPKQPPTTTTVPPTVNPPVPNTQKSPAVPAKPPVQPQPPPKREPSKPGPICSLPTEEVHPWIRQLYKDCAHPVVTAAIEDVVGPRGIRRSQVERFLKLADGSLNGRNDGQTPEFTTMRTILEENQIPMPFSFIAVQESGFTSGAKSEAGALGYWQLMPQTAIGLGITPAQCHQIAPSTRAASKFLNQLIRQWTNSRNELNFKMLLVSYNSGPARSSILRNSMEDKRDKGDQKFAGLTDSQIRGFSEDFWELYELGMLTRETRKFVPHILALIFGGIRPEQVGINQPGFPFLN